MSLSQTAFFLSACVQVAVMAADCIVFPTTQTHPCFGLFASTEVSASETVCRSRCLVVEWQASSHFYRRLTSKMCAFIWVLALLRVLVWVANTLLARQLQSSVVLGVWSYLLPEPQL